MKARNVLRIDVEAAWVEPVERMGAPAGLQPRVRR